ncbi:MAG TPA: Flp pilus assembly protein CpaB [Nakamurella sp.]
MLLRRAAAARRPSAVPGKSVPGQSAPWRRQLRRHRRVLAAGLAALSVVLVVRSVSPQPASTVPVLVAAHDLAPGAPVGIDDVTVARWPAGLAPAGTLTDPADLPQRPLATRVAVGEPLSDIRFLSPALIAAYGSGLVATPVRLADAGAAGLLHEGDLVDVLAAAPTSAGAVSLQGPGVQSATIVATGVRVVLAGTDRVNGAGDGTMSSTADNTDGSLVVLATTSAVAAALAGAAVSSRLSVVLRPG